jgi:Sulfotransferase domain
MVKDADRKTKKSRSRRDLASRLLRPHLFFLRSPTAAITVPRTAEDFAAENPFPARGRAAVDVICCGMYRACSTWQYEVLAHLVERYSGGTRLGYLTGAQYTALLRKEAAPDLETTRGPRVLKSHDGDRAFARSLAAGRALAVYAYRDVRDVVFSLMHKRGLSFEQLLRQGMIHQILANDRFWSRCPGVLVQRYEDLLAAPAQGVLELARHVGLDLDQADADRIAAEYSQESNRARTAALRHRLHQAGIDLDSAANAQICDATTLLHWNHMRDPNSSWRLEATNQHEAILDRLCGRWLIDHGYESTQPGGRLLASRRKRRRVSIQGKVDLAVGRSNHAIRNMSLRFPSAARRLKRLLGMPTDERVGATAWAGTGASDLAADRKHADVES